MEASFFADWADQLLQDVLHRHHAYEAIPVIDESDLRVLAPKAIDEIIDPNLGRDAIRLLDEILDCQMRVREVSSKKFLTIKMPMMLSSSP